MSKKGGADSLKILGSSILCLVRTNPNWKSMLSIDTALLEPLAEPAPRKPFLIYGVIRREFPISYKTGMCIKAVGNMNGL